MNRRALLLMVVPLLMVIPACQERECVTLNEGLVEAIQQPPVDNAIISQHTLYPYHFIANSAKLNELGRSDLNVLAAHYRQYPGALNVRRGSESEALYRARVQTVADALNDAGVDMAQVNISDGLAGGDGLPSEQVRRAMRKSEKEERTTPYEGLETPVGTTLFPGGTQ